MSLINIVVVGAGTDLGRTLLKRLVREPSNIILLEQSEKILERLISEFSSYKAHLHQYCLDWSNAEEIEIVFHEIYSNFQFVDTVVSLLDSCFFQNNGEKPGYSEAHEMIVMNFLANFTILNNALPMMLEENRGSIVALGERKFSETQYYSAAYRSSKMALANYWRETQKECFGKNVQLTLVQFNDPTYFTPHIVNTKQRVIPKNQPAVLEQISSMLEAIITRKYCRKVSSISLG